MAIGTLAEVVAGMGEAATPYCDRLLPVVMHGVGDFDGHVKQNSTYCIGCLCKSCPQKTLPHMQQILLSLQTLLSPECENKVDHPQSQMGFGLRCVVLVWVRQ